MKTRRKLKKARRSRHRASPAMPNRKGQRKGTRRRKGSRGVEGRAVDDRLPPGFGRWQGCSVALIVIERTGRHVDRVTSRLALSAETGGATKMPRGRKGVHRSSSLGVEIPARVCRTMFALGHVQRMRIIRKLLDVPATYQALKRLTRLKPGPLYHHVNQLRLAGLILPKQRDLYEITRAGRNMVLGAMALGPLSVDARRRPIA